MRSGGEGAGAPRPDHPRYRPDIDGLRAVAVLVVVGFHAFPEHLRGGFVGVDVFYVISGYLISSILLGGLAKGTFSFAEFYARRVRRIFPALIVVMLACWALGWFALFADEFAQLGRHVVGGAAFVANFVFWGEAGYFDNAAETKPLLHLWSLGIEEQFYIVWPLLLATAWRRRIPLKGALLLLAAASFAVNVAGMHRWPTATFYSPASRAWELVAGALLALGGRAAGPPSRRSGLLRDLQSVAGAALLGLGVALVDEERSFPGFWALLPVLGSAALVGAGPGAWVNRTVLSRRVLVWCGLISYPLYLWHWPLLSYARIVESRPPALEIRLAAVAASFALAWATYRLVERPFRFGGGARAKVAALAAAMALLALAGQVTAARDGLPARAAVRQNLAHQQALVLVEDRANAAACKRRYGFDTDWEYCLLAEPEQDPTVALVGDSHAYHLVAGLTRYYRSRGENLLYLGTRIPYWDVTPRPNDGYQKVTNRMLDIALTAPRVHTVIVSTAARFDGRDRPSRQLVRAARETLRRFLAADKRVILAADVPQLDFEPRACIRRAGLRSSTTKSPCAMERRVFERQTARHDAVVAELLEEFPDVTTFTPADFLCDARLCWAMLDGKLLYRDRGHLSYDGDLFVGARFAAEQERLREDSSGG